MRPGMVAQTGLDAARPLLEEASDLMGWVSVLENGVQILCLGLAWLLVIMAFFILAIQLFVTLIEFKLTTLAGFVLIPFCLFGKTAFMAERVLGNVVSSGIKVLVLAVIIGIGSTLFSQFTTGFGGTTLTVDDAMAIVLGALSLLGLGIFGPGIASGLVSGGPQLGAGAAAGAGLAVGGAALAAGGTALLGARAGAAAISSGAAAARGAASLAGGAGAAYSLGTVGRSGAAGVASGLGGVARAAGSAASSPLRRAGQSLRTSFHSGVRAGIGATGGRTTAAAPVATAANSNTPPAWAQRVQRRATLGPGASLAVHAVRAGDSRGSGAAVSLHSGERS